MEEHTSQYDPGQIPEETRREAVKKAPSTLAGLGIGGVLGALVAGHMGALLGGIIGGVIGYTRDAKRRHEVS